MNDAERRELTAIEHMLREEDPTFVRRFGPEPQRLGRRVNALILLALVAATAMTVLALRYRNVPAATVGLVGVGASAGVCISRWIEVAGYESDPDRPSSR